MKAIFIALALSSWLCHSLQAVTGGSVVVYTTWPGSGNVTNVPPGLTNVVSVSAGLADALALRDDGTVTAWGANDFGITNIPVGITNVAAISSGWYFHLALRTDGTVMTWGYPLTGAPSGLSNVVGIAAGGHQFCLALKRDGTIFAWGYSGYGQTNVPADLTNAVAVAAGLDHSLALRVDGTVAAWGDNTFGAAQVPNGLSNVVAIAAGWSQSYALRADGTVAAWGMDATNLPASLTNVAAIAAGWDAGKEVLFNDGGLLWNWAQLSNVTAIARGHFFAVAVTNTGRMQFGLPERLIGPFWRNGSFNATVLTLPGQVYSLQYKNRLEDDHWSLLPLLIGNGQLRQLRDPNATVPQRFYRLLRW